MQYCIAIIEDDPVEAAAMRSYFQRYTAERADQSDQFDLKLFTDGLLFLSDYQPIYDLVFLDMNLPKVSGMDIAIRLRQMDQSVPLIFVTSLARYAARGYEVDAMDFMQKPVAYTTFALKLQRALRRSQQARGSELLLSTTDGICRIASSRIKYIEVIDHSLVYHTTEGEFTSTGTLKVVEAKLDATQFIRCNRCYLINLAFVRGIHGYTVVVDRDELQISRPKRNAVMEALNNYLGGGV